MIATVGMKPVVVLYFYLKRNLSNLWIALLLSIEHPWLESLRQIV